YAEPTVSSSGKHIRVGTPKADSGRACACALEGSESPLARATHRRELPPRDVQVIDLDMASGRRAHQHDRAVERGQLGRRAESAGALSTERGARDNDENGAILCDAGMMSDA